MSRGLRLSIVGLYNFNNHVFDNMRFPAGFSEADQKTTIGNIMFECAELELLFPDYDYCKEMIGLWSKLNLPVWDRIYKASLKEYNPIENYNRTELETISQDGTDTHSGKDITSQSGTDTQLMQSSGTETNSGTDTSTNKITAYDSGQLYDHDKSTLDYGRKISDNNTGSNAFNYGKTDTLTHGEQITREGTSTRENHTSGNIGVTTSQQMLEQEIDVAPKLNVMRIICDSFKERFCLLIY